MIMTITEIPFWLLLLGTLLPLTIMVLIFFRFMEVIRDLLARYKEQDTGITMRTVGQLLVFMVLMASIIGIILYIVGEQPDSFSIFEFLIEDMLPLAWYTILLYGVVYQLSNLNRQMKRRKK